MKIHVEDLVVAVNEMLADIRRAVVHSKRSVEEVQQDETEAHNKLAEFLKPYGLELDCSKR